MNAKVDFQDLSQRLEAKPKKKAISYMEDASCSLNSLIATLLCTVSSYGEWDLDDESLKAMLTVSENIANRALIELDQAKNLGFGCSIDFHQQIQGVVISIQEISKLFLGGEYTVRALYGIHYAVEHIYDVLDNCISSFYKNSSAQ